MRSDFRSFHLCQTQVTELRPSENIFGVKRARKFLFLLLTCFLILILALVAGVFGGKLLTDIIFNSHGFSYLSIIIFIILLISALRLTKQGILATLLQAVGISFVWVPLLTLVLIGIGASHKPATLLLGGGIFNALDVGFSIFSIVIFAVILRILQCLFCRQYIALHWLLNSLMIGCSAGLAAQLSLDSFFKSDALASPRVDIAVIGGLLWSILTVVIGAHLSNVMIGYHSQFFWLKKGCSSIVAWAGTSFYDLDLSGLNFTNSNIANCDFRVKSLYRTCLLGMRGIDSAHVDNRYLDLENPNVQRLLTSGSVVDKKMQRVSLRGAFLQNADLQGVNLIEATLHGADLQKANLRGALLCWAKVTNVDFAKADLTGCCIQGWSINASTNFTGVICNYIYQELENGRPTSRYPRDRDFEPGEFATLHHQINNSTELVFSGETDMRALSFTFEKFKLEDSGLGLELQGIEQRGDLWIVKVAHNAEASREQVEQEVNTAYDDLKELFEARYQLALKAKEEEISRLSQYNESQRHFIEGLITGLVESSQQELNTEEARVILFLTASPAETSQRRLDEELREIDESLRRSQKRSQFELINKGAVRCRDFYRAILDTHPQIIHFSGHGDKADGLALEDELGNAKFLGNEQLLALFEMFAEEGVECIVLNACYSETQAKAICKHIPYVIGMNQSISSQAGITFSVAFYDCLGAGYDLDFAFKLAKSQLIPSGEHKIPEMLRKPPELEQ